MNLEAVKTDRYRGGETLLREQWTPAQAARCGFEYGRFTPTTEIARILGNGIIAATVRAVVNRRWNLPSNGREARVGVLLSQEDARLLKQRAAEAGISEEEYSNRILQCVMGDDMVTAVIGR